MTHHVVTIKPTGDNLLRWLVLIDGWPRALTITHRGALRVARRLLKAEIAIPEVLS